MEAVSDDETSSKRRGSLSDDDVKNVKKSKRFFAKHFRKQITTSDKLSALTEFLDAVKSQLKHDYIFEYLEAGGNCLELLNTLESDSSIPPAIVFDLVANVLLSINAKYSQYYSAAYEACRYLINNYLSVINKMLGLSSSKEERKACLKLLTAMVAFSSSLAKDVLLNVKFHSTNIELLTKHTGEKNSVRDGFIHFLCAFLVDGHYPTISLLLEKSGLLTSIIAGLQYDNAEAVCIVITAMKNHVLEHPSMYKTAKMKVFNTSVVREIVNLYNWKGPDGLKAKEKKNTVFEIDRVSKSQVSECVHQFLEVLCTSHKNGVIFRDPLVGLGKKNQNSLMYTVLESLDRPWEHSYASQLVIGICKACPDLAKTMWSNLKPFLEPRLTEKWINALTFAKQLVQELDPSCIQVQAKDLNVFQLSQIIEILVAPLPILKTINLETQLNENLELKQKILVLLQEMLNSFQKYVKHSESWLNSENHKQLKTHLSEYIIRNFPSAKSLINVDFSDTISESDMIQYLTNATDILIAYKNLAPQLLISLDVSNTFFRDLLININSIESENIINLQIKIINLLINFDSSQLLPKTELYDFVMPILLKDYHDRIDLNTFDVLKKILTNCGIFDGCYNEESLWLNGVLNIETFDENTANQIAEIFKTCSENILNYQQQLSDISVESYVGPNYKEIIENLLTTDSSNESTAYTLKHRGLSPMIISFFEYISENNSKHMKKYIEYVLINLLHMQTSFNGIIFVSDKYNKNIPKHVFQYMQNCFSFEPKPIRKIDGKLEIFKKFGEKFLNEKLTDIFLQDIDFQMYPDVILNLLHAATFYFSDVLNSSDLSTIQITGENWEYFIKYLSNKIKFDDSCLNAVLGNTILLQHFSILHSDKNKPSNVCSRHIIEVIKNLSNLDYGIENYVSLYRNKVVNALHKISSKPQKYSTLDLSNFLQLFNLNYNQCVRILHSVLKFTNDYIPVVYDVLNYCLIQISTLCLENSKLDPLETEVVNNISCYLLNLNERNIDGHLLALSLKKYLEIFPHSIEYLDHNLMNVVCQKEHSKEAVDLICFLLERNTVYVNIFKNDIEKILDNKAVLIPLLDVLLGCKNNELIDLKLVYDKLEPYLNKMLIKPQKAAQYFQQNNNISVLFDKFMPLEKCLQFFHKVQKFEVSEIFHSKLLKSIAIKVINEDLNEKLAINIILTFIHLQTNVLKRVSEFKDDNNKVSEISRVFNEVLGLLIRNGTIKELNSIGSNDAVKLYCKLCLKFGVSGQSFLLDALTNLMKLSGSSNELEEVRLVLGMLISHSKFLDVIMGDSNELKYSVISLFFVICENYGDLMERNHISLLLAAYGAKIDKCDRVILKLLKMYESRADQTKFYDFKPILWGRAAATHYSVRIRLENTLLQQPKMSDVLNVLQESSVNNTIKNYPIAQRTDGNESGGSRIDVYDLSFLLPLFSQLLAPEQQVKTYLFTKSGALSLTVVGLASRDKEIRQAACHVLSRLHFHLEARQTGKDNLLWIRYIEALCKGTAVLPDYKLNDFAAIFLAKMAIILSQPKHVMYYPLSRYLTAKADLDFSTIPELYTLIHSSDVNYKDHRIFILKVIKDGLKCDKDFTSLLKSMAYKLFSELYSSPVSDFETKLLILDVMISICNLPLGCKMLCENHSFLSQINSILSEHFHDETKNRTQVVAKIVEIFYNLVKYKSDKYSNSVIYRSVIKIVNSLMFASLQEQCKKKCFNILYIIYDTFPELVNLSDVNVVIENNCERYCKYIADYGCKYLREADLTNLDDQYYFLRLLLFKIYKSK